MEQISDGLKVEWEVPKSSTEFLDKWAKLIKGTAPKVPMLDITVIYARKRHNARQVKKLVRKGVIKSTTFKNCIPAGLVQDEVATAGQPITMNVSFSYDNQERPATSNQAVTLRCKV